MRPIRLEVEGFTCYRDRQEPLEFGGLSLFAIAGPTGAGKSSILDTMLYALYGEIPRIGKQGIGEVISQGRDVLSVCFDFSVQGRAYRVTRRVKRGKKGALTTTATIAEITDGGERNIADQVRPVNDAVISLLGLDYSAFTQTVVLPQGEFARFLKSDPKGQREILQHLLRHDVFQRMREEAEKRRSQLQAELLGVERQVREHEGHTEDTLAAKRLELSAAHESLRRTSDERTAIDRHVQESRRLRQLTEDFSRLKKERVFLDAEDPDIARARAELTLARKAAQITPRLEAFNTAALRSQDAARERARVAAAASDISARQVVAEQEAASATEAARQCGELNERIRLIDEMKGDLDRRRTLITQLQKLARGLPAAENQATEAKQLLDAAQRAVDAARGQLDAHQAAIAAIGYDEKLHMLLDELWTRVVQARAAGEEITRLGRDHAVLDADHRKAERDRSIARQAHLQASAAADAGTQAAANAAVALADAQTRHQAAALRSHLHAGDDCPVCLQQVPVIPTVAAPPELATLTQQRNEAEARAEKSRRASLAAGQELAAAEARLTAITTTREAAAAKAQERIEARSKLETEIVAALNHTSAPLDPTEALSWTETTRTELVQANHDRARIDDLLRRANAALQDAEVRLLKAETDARRAAEQHAEALQQHGACNADLEAVVERILSVSRHPDPSTERTELAARVVALQTLERTAGAKLSDLQQAAAGATAALAAATTAVDTAEADKDTARFGLDDALRSAGFTTADEAKSATRTDTQQAALDATIRKHDDARVVLSRRLLEVEPQIVGKEIDAEMLAAAEHQLSDAVDAWQRAGVAVSDLDGECGRLASAVARRSQLLVERDALGARHSITAEMALDLKGDAFQEYLLEEAFRGLVTGASVRMREISNRYTLEWDAGDFYVVDHDNAGERRRAETLSGGETFMASLCLALQLSDEVLRTSGALQMDSLFIDEGFGTLDSGSLEEVTDAMEALRQEGGRLIGVISHRPELTDRLPGCIRIDKGAGESRWILERVG